MLDSQRQFEQIFFQMFALGFAGKTLQRKAHVHRHLQQQIARRFVEGMRLTRIQSHYANDCIAAQERNRCRCSPAELDAAFVPGGCGRIINEVLAPKGPVFAQGSTGRSAPGRIGGIRGNLEAFEIFRAGTERGDRFYLFALRIHHADPRHFHAAEVHCVATDNGEKLVNIGATDDGLIALTQCGIEFGEPQYLRFVGLALRDVARQCDEMRRFRYRGLHSGH